VDPWSGLVFDESSRWIPVAVNNFTSRCIGMPTGAASFAHQGDRRKARSSYRCSSDTCFAAVEMETRHGTGQETLTCHRLPVRQRRGQPHAIAGNHHEQYLEHELIGLATQEGLPRKVLSSMPKVARCLTPADSVSNGQIGAGPAIRLCDQVGEATPAASTGSRQAAAARISERTAPVGGADGRIRRRAACHGGALRRHASRQ
jgi:hypothetical protein